jgi:thiamine biosynthesis lipoprotein
MRAMKRRPLLAFVAALAVGCHERDASPPPAPPPAPTSLLASSSSAPGDLGPTTEAGTPAVVPAAPVRVTAEDKAMGTHLAFAAYTTVALDEAAVRKAFDAGVAEIRRVEGLMTTWRPDSELSRVNAAAGKAPVQVSQETFDVVKEAVHASEISEGTFDITFHTLHGLWKFDEDLDPHPPKDADVKARLPFVGYKKIELDDAKKTIRLATPKTQIGLGGIAKGYAVDKAVKVLEGIGLTSFFVQAGGDLFARGKKPDGSPWTAGIRDPRGPENKYFARLAISDHAFSTAGDYERSYVVSGKRYHHILDPRTGQPATASRSVTIWAPNALLADEIDDAVFILGPEKGLKLVESLDGVGAVIVDAKNNLWVSKRLEGQLQVVGAPTDGI